MTVSNVASFRTVIGLEPAIDSRDDAAEEAMVAADVAATAAEARVLPRIVAAPCPGHCSQDRAGPPPAQRAALRKPAWGVGDRPHAHCRTGAATARGWSVTDVCHPATATTTDRNPLHQPEGSVKDRLPPQSQSEQLDRVPDLQDRATPATKSPSRDRGGSPLRREQSASKDPGSDAGDAPPTT